MNTDHPTVRNLGAVILAAGRSHRMGRPKLLLPWGKTSVLGHQIRAWQELGAGQVAVVCAANDEPIGVELDRLNFPPDARIYNPAPERGMFSSIRCATQWSGWSDQTERVAIVLGDQPQVRQETLRVLLGFSGQHSAWICQPRFHGRARHPVILPKPLFASLSDCSASSLREFLQGFAAQAALCDVEDPGLELDLDTPGDYARALAVCCPPT